jgi:PAS domain S-box-containing protein
MHANEARLQLLVDTGLLLARERSLDVIVQAALDAGLKLCGAAFGAFFYNSASPDGGEPYQLYKLSGTAAEAFAGFPLPRPTAIFSHTFEGKGILRSDDIKQDPRYGRNAPLDGLPPRHIPVRSYLAVPVQGRTGEVLGGMFYGHPDPGKFDAGCESLVATIAAQAAVAMDNVRLAETLTTEIALADNARRLQRETAERLAEVFEATTDAVFLLNRDWRFTYLNQRAIDLIAEGRDLVGQNVWQAFPAAAGTAFQDGYSEVMNGQGTAEFTEFYPPLSLWFAIRAYPTAEGIAVFFQDVTQERQRERERMDNARRLRQALDAGQLGTWTWDRATDLLDLDERAAELLLGPVHTPVARTALRERIVHHDDLGMTPQNLQENLANGGVYAAEYRVQATDGSQHWVSTRGTATFAEGSAEMTGMIGTVQDITARKTQEAALRQSEKLAATGRLAATIAHEINNPLEAVTNLIYLSKTDPQVPTPVQRLLETADNELARVAQIAQQTLGFYRDTTRPVDINLSDLLSSVVNLFSRKMQYKKIDCKLEVEPDLHIFGLQGEVRQVFSNLIVNAIDASQGGGRRSLIRIRARARTLNGRAGVSILISDQGSGIPAAVRQRLFSPFFTTKQSVGTGLGLWVTRGIIEKQGGAVGFRTRTEAPAGTVFRVFLPAENHVTEQLSAPVSTFLQ